MAEAHAPGASVSEVARRHGVNANLLFKWLRLAGRRRQETLEALAPGDAASSGLEFVPLGVFSRDEETGEATVKLPVVAAATAAEPSRPPVPAIPKLEERAGVIEIDLPDGTRVRVDALVSERALRRVLQAVKGQS